MSNITNPALDPVTLSQRSQVTNPDRFMVVEESLVDTTNEPASTNYYPSSSGSTMLGFSDLSFTGKLIVGAAQSITLYLEVTNDEDASTGDWHKVYLYDDMNDVTVNQIVASDETKLFSLSANRANFKRWRLVIVPTIATNTVIAKARRSYA